jgi:hypothetical protein
MMTGGVMVAIPHMVRHTVLPLRCDIREQRTKRKQAREHKHNYVLLVT